MVARTLKSQGKQNIYKTLAANRVNWLWSPEHSNLKGNKTYIKPWLLTVLTGYGRPEHSNLKGNKTYIKPWLLTVLTGYGRPNTQISRETNKTYIKPCLLTVLTGYGRPEHSHLIIAGYSWFIPL